MYVCMYVCIYVTNATGMHYCNIFPVDAALLSCTCSRAKSMHYDRVALQKGGSDWEGYVCSNPEEW